MTSARATALAWLKMSITISQIPSWCFLISYHTLKVLNARLRAFLLPSHGSQHGDSWDDGSWLTVLKCNKAPLAPIHSISSGRILQYVSQHAFLAILTHNPLRSGYMSKRIKVQGTMLWQSSIVPIVCILHWVIFAVLHRNPGANSDYLKLCGDRLAEKLFPGFKWSS